MGGDACCMEVYRLTPNLMGPIICMHTQQLLSTCCLQSRCATPTPPIHTPPIVCLCLCTCHVWAAQVGGILRIAHCGGLHMPDLNKLIDAINFVAKLLHKRICWDTETLGCVPSLSSIPSMDQRLLTEALQVDGAGSPGTCYAYSSAHCTCGADQPLCTSGWPLYAALCTYTCG